MLSNMSCSLIMHKRIKTTLAKAKALKRFVEPIITRSKLDTTHNRRIAFRYLRQKDAITELFSVVSDKVSDRQGGYTRIIKLGHRLGDSAEMCFIELVDFNETYNVDDRKTKKTRRSRRSDKGESKKTLDQVSPDLVEESPVAETPTEEVSAEEETPTEESPVEESPVEEAPVEETPTKETSAEETPVEEISEEKESKKSDSGDKDES